MRLHTLTLQAVGPFAGRHTVDFAALSAGGLFLLEGPTGAGKSTVIDAIVFALYGKVASAAASEERLRSAFAADDTETLVDLVFETGAGVYRVRRTPAYERAKLRGQGRARQQATVKLWRLTAVPEGVMPEGGTPHGVAPDGVAPEGAAYPADQPGELVSTRLDEAGAELTRIVGLDRAQFVQTMVLPQGEFASFLRADPEQRRGLLQRIFGTEVYERVQQRLEELRREAQRAVAEAQSVVQEAVARFTGAAGTAGEDTEALRAAAGDEPQGVAAHVGTIVSALRVGLAAAESDSAEAAGRATAARAAVEAATTRLHLLRRRAALVAERVRLTAGTAVHEAEVAALDRARRAAVVRPVLRGLDDARSGLAGTQKELRAALDGAPDGLAPAGVGDALRDTGLPEALTRARQEAAAQVATLTRLVALEESLPRRERDLGRLREAQMQRARAIAEADEELAARPDDRTRLADALERATDVAATAPARAHEFADAEAVLAAVDELIALEHAVTVATEAHAVATDRAVEAVREEAALRIARLQGFAGELAAALEGGEPCPVCGGVDHPHPAPLAPGHVGEQEVAAAERRRGDAEEVRRTAGARLAALTERVDGARARTAGRGAQQRDEAAAEVERAGAALRATEVAGGDRDRCRAALVEHDRVTDVLREQRAVLDREHRDATGEIDRTARELSRDRDEVAVARDGHPSVLARQGVEQARADGATAVLDALDRIGHAVRAVEARAVELSTVLHEQGVEDEESARAVTAEAVDIAAVERAVEAHRTAVRRVDDGLRDPEIAALTDQAPGALTDEGPGALADEDPGAFADQDPGAFETVVVELGDELTAAVARAAAAAATVASMRDRVGRGTAAAEQVTAAVAALERATHDAGPVARMARLAGGADADNTRALSLATYVLVRRFEDVVAAANDRLREMSDGRYELERSDEREAVRTRRTGLAMRVVDHTTERTRDPRTLSGGETFYVSLCLALGMADVVTAEAGGVELGTLFIDEGFGSLDPHTLDAVLAELGRLRAGGRVVGVVSHVEALKHAVAERIEVRRRPDGSSTLTTIAI